MFKCFGVAGFEGGGGWSWCSTMYSVCRFLITCLFLPFIAAMQMHKRRDAISAAADMRINNQSINILNKKNQYLIDQNAIKLSQQSDFNCLVLYLAYIRFLKSIVIV